MCVGWFITENEDITSIQEGLTFFKKWTGEGIWWNNFMIDYSFAEMNAIQDTFPGYFLLFIIQ